VITTGDFADLQRQTDKRSCMDARQSAEQPNTMQNDCSAWNGYDFSQGGRQVVVLANKNQMNKYNLSPSSSCPLFVSLCPYSQAVFLQVENILQLSSLIFHNNDNVIINIIFSLTRKISLILQSRKC
jgi:hypothetical protein